MNATFLAWLVGLFLTIGITGTSMVLQGRALKRPRRNGRELIWAGSISIFFAICYMVAFVWDAIWFALKI
jgi:hypothetical protein